ncbi:hypothetical protein BaRGS_00001749 [Batillaria attramentaria]|uniref:G-protein coupled receptors family 1 profile domain-containing protein n=1 Tax=Batillaria attramentaria TaxID=370345 RepID=A0ABD0M6U5_9CAEN
MAELNATDWVYSVAECLSGLLAILGNVLVLVAIGTTRSLRTVTNCFIGSLALADVLVGIAIPPSVILSYFGLPRNFDGCVLLNSLVVLITNISILNLIAVALERYLAICHPFLYQRVMTIPRAMAVVTVTWIIAILLGLVPNMGWNLGEENFEGFCAFTVVIGMDYMVYMIFFGVNIPPLVFMFCVYAYIFHIIRKLNKQVASQMTVLSHDGRSSARRQKREVRGAKSLAYVIILFAVCWMPIHVLNCISLFAPEKSPPFQVLLFTIVLSHANSFMNPIVYAFSNTQFKRAFVRILCCKEGQVSYTTESSGGYTTAAGTQFHNSKAPSDQPPSDSSKIGNGVTPNFVTQDVSQTDSHSTPPPVSNGVVNKAFDDGSDSGDDERRRSSLGTVKSPDSKNVKWSDRHSASSSELGASRQHVACLEMENTTNSNPHEPSTDNNERRLGGADDGRRSPKGSNGAVWATASSLTAITPGGTVHRPSPHSSPQLQRSAEEENPYTTPTVVTNSGAVTSPHLGDNTGQELVLDEDVNAEMESDSSVPGAPPWSLCLTNFSHGDKPNGVDSDKLSNVSTVSLRSAGTGTGDSDSMSGSKHYVSIRL